MPLAQYALAVASSARKPIDAGKAMILLRGLIVSFVFVPLALHSEAALF
jgi:hypothetical protein